MRYLLSYEILRHFREEFLQVTNSIDSLPATPGSAGLRQLLARRSREHALERLAGAAGHNLVQLCAPPETPQWRSL